MGNVYEQAAILEGTEKMTANDFKSVAIFKKKYDEQLKEAEEKFKDKPKKLAKFAYLWYFAVQGNNFYSDFDGAYVSLLPIIIPAIKKYCDDKQKDRIKKSIEQNVKSIEDAAAKGTQLNRRQKGWLKDIKAVKL